MTAIFAGPAARNRLLTFGAAAAVCALMLWLDMQDLTRLPLDGDEAFSVTLALLPWGECWRGAVADATHPPVFTLILKLWVAIGGHSLVWLRLLPALASLALLVPVYLLLREFAFPRGAAVLALAAVAASAPRIEYSHVVRCYALYALAAGFSMWLFARNARRGRVGRGWTAAYVASTAVLCSLEYFGLWVAGVQLLLAAAVYRSELRRVCAAIAAAFCISLFWLPEVARAMSSGTRLENFIGWIPRPGFYQVPWLYHCLLGGPGIAALYRSLLPGSLWRHLMPVGLLLVFPPLALWCGRVVRHREWPQADESTHALLQFGAYASIPVAGTWCLSLAGPVSLFGARLLIFAVVPYCLLVARAVWLLRRRWLRTVFSGALMAWCVSAAVAQAWRPDRSVRWDELAACVAADPAGAALPVVAAESFVRIPYRLLLQLSGQPSESVALVPAFRGKLPQRFWALYRDLNDRPEYAHELAALLSAQGYAVERRCAARAGGYAVIFDLERESGPAPPNQ